MENIRKYITEIDPVYMETPYRYRRCLLGLICPLRVQIQFEPFGSGIFLSPSEELELCDLSCNTPSLIKYKKSKFGQKNCKCS